MRELKGNLDRCRGDLPTGRMRVLQRSNSKTVRKSSAAALNGRAAIGNPWKDVWIVVKADQQLNPIVDSKNSAARHLNWGSAVVPGHIIPLARKLSPHLIGTRLGVGASAVLLATAIVATPAAIKANGPAKLVISRATTYITSPLGKDGLPDYTLALKQYLMKGLTQKNNAAVPAIEIAMRGYFSDEANSQWVNYGKLGTAQLKALGIKPPTRKYPQIHDIGAFFKRHLPQGYKLPSTGLTGLGGTPSWNLMGLETGYVSEFPWRKSQFFLLWADLYRNRSSIKILRKASLMPRFYLPMIYDQKRFKWPVVCIEPLPDVLGQGGSMLAYRATLELGRGHPQKCWNDAMAVYRLSRLAHQQPDAFGLGNADALLRQFLDVCDVLLRKLRHRPHELARVWKTIQKLPLSAPEGKRYLHVQRIKALQVLLECYRHRQAPPMQPLAQTLSKKNMPGIIIMHPPAAINWNWQFAHLNATFDRVKGMVDAPADSTGGRHMRAFYKVWTSAGDDISVMAGYSPPVPPGDVGYIPKSLNRLLAKQLPLQTRYLNMLLMTTNSFYGWNQSCYQTLRSLMLIKIAYALEMYHSEHGHYPRALAALSPAFFALPPVDPITGKPPFYVRSTKGYGLTLYKWMLHSKRVEVPFLGPQCIIMPPPPPRSWQTYKFP